MSLWVVTLFFVFGQALNGNMTLSLASFFDALGGQQWSGAYRACERGNFSSGVACWFTNEDPCTWWGIQCRGEVLTSLILAETNLVGKLPSTIGDFSDLVILNLRGNKIRGAIPSTLRRLVHLEILDLSTNELSGNPFQSLACPNLLSLYLRNNQFYGPWMQMNVLDALPALQRLWIDNCGFEGEVASSATFSRLTFLSMNSNNFCGGLDFLSNASSMLKLSLAFNKFSGPIPAVLFSSSVLTDLDLSNNLLNGTFDGSSFLNASALRRINLSYNKGINGELPTGFSLLPNISVVQLREMALFGPLPTLKGCSRLTKLDLEGNNFVGTIPTAWFSTIPSIQMIDVSGNFVSGALPEHVPSGWNFIVSLDLSRNNMSGVVPRWLDDLDSSDALVVVSLTDNALLQAPDPVRIPSWIDVDDFSSETFGNYSCNQFKLHGGARLRLPPQYFNFQTCKCLNGFWGVPPICHPCGIRDTTEERLECAGGAVALTPNGSYPVFEGGTLLGFDACEWFWKEGQRFSPCQRARLTWLSSNLSNDLCWPGYGNRLCSECLVGFYESGSECRPCSKADVWLWVGLGVVLLAILVFIAIPHLGVMYLWGEIVAFLVLLIIAGGSSWILTFVVSIALLQAILLLYRHFRKNKRVLVKNEVVSLGGFVKISVFFVQTSVSINGSLWHSFSYFISWLDFVTLNMSGSRCFTFLDPLYASELGKFLLFMFVPVLLFVVVVSIVAMRLLAQRLLFRLGLRHLQTRKPLLLLREHEGEEESYSESEDAVLELQQPRTLWLESAASIGLFLLFVSYYDLAEKAFSVFSPKWSLQGKFMETLPWIRFSIEDYTFQTLFICGVVFSVVYGLGVPCLFWFLLRFRREREHPAAFLWECYKPSYYAYEIAWIVRRLGVALVVAAFPEFGGVRTFFIAALLMSFAVVQSVHRPFLRRFENILDVLSTLTLVVTFCCVQWAQSDKESTGVPLSFYFSLVLSLLFVLGMFGALLYPILVALWTRIRKCVKMRRKNSVGEREVVSTEVDDVVEGKLESDD